MQALYFVHRLLWQCVIMLHLCRSFPEAFTQRCFAFEPSDQQVESSTSVKMVLFPAVTSGRSLLACHTMCASPYLPLLYTIACAVIILFTILFIIITIILFNVMTGQ